MQAVQFDADLIKQYGGRGPRYTSYPTAVQFHTGFNEGDYRNQVALSNELPIPSPLSIYIHIPFCKSLCYYCGCNKIITQHTEQADTYLKYLYKEIKLQSQLFNNDRVVQQLHFGGGTPTYLSDKQLQELMIFLAKHFQLNTNGQQEYSIEIDPRTIDTDRLHALSGMGFNRVSMGVQDFDPKVQQAVNRIQSVEDTLNLIQQSHAAGYKSVSVDLIYGLPFQTLDSFDKTLDLIIEASPDRIAVYNYAHLPDMFKAQRLIREEHLPTPKAKLEILEHTIDKLQQAGYYYIGMDHFAKKQDELVKKAGELQRNFQGYSTHSHCDMIGLGVSSIGNVSDCYSQNHKVLKDYYAALDNHHLPVQRGLILDKDDRLRADIIQTLMCRGELIFSDIEDRHEISFSNYFKAELEELEKLALDGLITVDADSIKITPVGFLLLRAITMVFDKYLNQPNNIQRFSRVI